MHAAVLHTIGAMPRFEEFPEPIIGGDKDGEVIVHVHAASLKPVDKQLASGSHYASRGELPRVCGSDGVGHLDDGQRIFFRSPTGPKAWTMSVAIAGGDAVPTAEVIGGSHMSLSPDQSMIMDVVGHRVLWVSPLNPSASLRAGSGAPRKVFEFDDADGRIDYPVWSPDGRWILFDRFTPHSGDVWMVEP